MARAAQIVTTAALLTAAALLTSAAAPATPTSVEVYLRAADGPAKPVRGSVVDYTDTTFVLKVGTDPRTFSWTDCTPATAFALRQKLTDKGTPADKLALGKFGWAIGAKDQAQAALRAAVRADPSLKSQADAVLASPFAAAAKPPASRPAQAFDTGDDTGDDAKPPGVASPVQVAPPTETDDGQPIVRFQPATPEEAAAAMAKARKQAKDVEKKVGVKLVEFETAHFLVFTDFADSDHAPLKDNLEGAYRVVARQFDTDPKGNVFAGKLPIYMIREFDDFARLARDVDHFPKVTQSLAGYYSGTNDGTGHMAMWKPTRALIGTDDLDEARRVWARTLVHEFTHAFLARYKTNVWVTRWLNEGIAEVIASQQFPDAARRRHARMMAANGYDVTPLFNDRQMPGGEAYPVMQSMVEFLASRGRPAFLAFFDAIKNGTKPEKALRETYGLDFRTFAADWKQWAKSRS